eukprot:COSAG04_NODE_10209_length_796_cov_0.967001_1_plen_157_part_10
MAGGITVSDDGVSKAARTRQLYNQRKHHRTKAKKNRFEEFAAWVVGTFGEGRLYGGRGCLDVAVRSRPAPCLSCRPFALQGCPPFGCCANERQPSRPEAAESEANSAVLPVAAQGGKGSLAYELAVSLGRPVECTVVDTHAVQFSVFRSKEFLHRCG